MEDVLRCYVCARVCGRGCRELRSCRRYGNRRQALGVLRISSSALCSTRRCFDPVSINISRNLPMTCSETLTSAKLLPDNYELLFFSLFFLLSFHLLPPPSHPFLLLLLHPLIPISISLHLYLLHPNNHLTLPTHNHLQQTHYHLQLQLHQTNLKHHPTIHRPQNLVTLHLAFRRSKHLHLFIITYLLNAQS